MTIAGLVLAIIGEGVQFNMPRFTMGIMDLQSGIGFITLAMAMFAIPETLFLVLDPARSGKASDKQSEISNLRITREEAKKIAPVVGRQSIQGFLIGVMPGAGATIASFPRLCCGAQHRPEGRTGGVWQALKGLAAPESANNAACTGRLCRF